MKLRAKGIRRQTAHQTIIESVEQDLPLETIGAAADEALKAKPGAAIAIGFVVAILKRWKDDARRMDVSRAQVPSRAISARDGSRAAAATSI